MVSTWHLDRKRAEAFPYVDTQHHAHMDSVGSLGHHTSADHRHIEALHQLAEVGSVVEAVQRPDSRSVAAVDHHPYAAASCLVGRILEDLEVGHHHHCERLLGGHAPRLVFAHFLLPSSSLSTPSESL